VFESIIALRVGDLAGGHVDNAGLDSSCFVTATHELDSINVDRTVRARINNVIHPFAPRMKLNVAGSCNDKQLNISNSLTIFTDVSYGTSAQLPWQHIALQIFPCCEVNHVTERLVKECSK